MQQRNLLVTGLFAVSLVLGASEASAQPKPWYWSWWPSHWENQRFEPYLEHPKHPHNTQWDSEKWEPADWAAQKQGGSLELIRGFYSANILSGQYVDDELPVLEVGPNFYHLSGQDKRRVTALVDDYYKITTNHLNAMYEIRDWRTHKPIGTYTTRGLHLQ